MATALATRREAEPKVTLDQYLEMPPTKPYSEYVDGEVIQKPMGDNYHTGLQGFFYLLLSTFLREHPIGSVGPEWRCFFGPPGRVRGLVPDITYVSKERRTPGRRQEQAPDLALEVLSPDQAVARFLDKLDSYLHNGVRLVWVTDPDEQVILVLQPGLRSRLLMAGDTLDGGDVLPGFSVSVDEIFAHLQP